MEKHSYMLEKLCRLCGKKIVTRRGYVTPRSCSDFKDVLPQYFGILESEDKNCYPDKFCSSCKNRLQYIKKNSKDYSNHAPVIHFEPHTDDDCPVCAGKTERTRGSSQHIKNFDTQFSYQNFVKIPSKLAADRVYCLTKLGESNVVVTITVRVHKDFTWSLYIRHKMLVNAGAKFELPLVLDDENIESFCEKISAFKLCPGNTEFTDVLKDRVDFKEPFPSTESDDRIAFVESSKGHSMLIKEDFDIIRSAECGLVTNLNSDICESCKVLRKRLSGYKKRAADKDKNRDQRTSSSSTTNIKTLKIDELEERLKNAQISKKQALSKLAHTSQRLTKLIQQEGVNPSEITESQHGLFKNILNKNRPNFEEGSPQWLLWQTQAEQASKEDSRGMRWHPLIIRWCISIYMISPAAYKQIASKQNKFLVLPHVKTLKKFINFTTPTSGFNPEIISNIIEDVKLGELEDYQKNVALSFDEIKIKSGLVYKKSSGKVIGFTEMGEMNEEIKQLSDRCDSEEKNETPAFATYVLVLMVRGIFTKLCAPIGYFSSAGMRGEELCPLVLEATRILEALSFKVRSWTSDGATPNRKLYTIASIGEPFFYSTNIFADDRRICFISDAPHLMKTLRNNIENSHGNLKSRNLIHNQQEISWMHIVDVYEWDLGLNRAALGMRMLHKLKEEHIRLSPKHRMSVKYAVQVISNSVACALEMQDRHDTKETIKFIKLFDRAFDCLNVTRIKMSDKPDRQAFRSPNDPRFEFLESVIKYLEDWEAEIEAIVGLTRDEQSRLLLSHQTVLGWKLTITSFNDLARTLLNEAGPGKFILSEKFSQDPLEEHFSRHRRIAGCNDNPSLETFEQQEVALHVMSSDLIADLRGNTRGRQTKRAPLVATDMRLPRKKPSKK